MIGSTSREEEVVEEDAVASHSVRYSFVVAVVVLCEPAAPHHSGGNFWRPCEERSHS